MKKIALIVFPLMLAVLAGCSKSESWSYHAVSVSLKPGSQHELKLAYPEIVELPDEFVCAYSDGKVTGVHVGTTHMVARAGRSEYRFDIAVTPITTLYTDLSEFFGADKTAVAKVYGEPYAIDPATNTGYYEAKDNEKYFAFTYDWNNRVSGAEIVFDRSYEVYLLSHLNERYQSYSVASDYIVYGNAPERKTADLLVEVFYEGSEMRVNYSAQ